MAPHTQPVRALKPLCIDLDATIPFLRAVSYAIVAQRTTRAAWRDDEGALSSVVRAFYGSFSVPGTVEIVSADDRQIRQQVEVETLHRIDVLLKKAELGPAAVAKYVADLEELRAYNVKALQDLYAEANALNREITAEWGNSIAYLARVQFAATTAQKVLGLIPGSSILLALGYDVALDVVENLSHANKANGVFVVASTTARTEGGKELIGHVNEKLVDRLNGRPTEKELKFAWTRMRQLEEKLVRQSSTLSKRMSALQAGARGPAIRDSIRSLDTQIGRNAGLLDQAQKGVAKSAGKWALSKAVAVVFAARDVLKAYDKQNEIVAAARQ